VVRERDPREMVAGVPDLNRPTQRHRGPFRIVQPWGPDKARQATIISEHATAAEAFAEIDRLSAQMVRTGARSDYVELLVVDAAAQIVRRPDAH
jgi:hypothetical protein